RLARVHVLPRIGSIEVAKLRPADVEALTAAIIEAGRSPTTAVAARQLLRRALADAVRDGLAARNAAALARPPRRAARALVAGRDFLTPEQLRALLAACEVDDEVGPLVALAALTGMRLGEVLGLRWVDVDREAATVTVRGALVRDYDDRLVLAEPKTPRARRTIPLAPLALAALERQARLQAACRAAAGEAWQDRWGLVFTDPLGRPWPDWAVNHRFHRLLDRAGLPSIAFHGLRHSWASVALVAGVPMRVVAEVLGHASPAFTASVYAGVAPELPRAAVGALEGLLR
ncbi:MAG TPA: site-specific integrase, partial [Candidatus Binatia bacterium]|nr:site-specific integrase [Candidatus Binatia bacterium]